MPATAPEPVLPVLRPDATPAEIRASLEAFEAVLATHPQAVEGDSDQFPLTHTWGGGLYLREIVIPQGSLLTGKIHKTEHAVFLMQGRIRVVSEEGGMQELSAPAYFLSAAGTKRAALALSDVVWVTVHATTTTNLETLEEELIAPSFTAYAQWRVAVEGGDRCRSLPLG